MNANVRKDTIRPSTTGFDHPVGWKLTKLECLYRQSRLFRWQLTGDTVIMPLPIIHDLWRGDAISGAQMTRGVLPFAVNSADYARFGWVRDIRDFGGSSARTTARNMINRWMQENRRWTALAWRPDIIGERLANLIFTYGWFGDSADEDFQTRFAQMIAIQARCLSMDWQRLRLLDQQILALKGLIISQVMIGHHSSSPKHMRDMSALFDLLIAKVKGQLNSDGGHRSRQPETHLTLLKVLLECRVAMGYLGMTELHVIDDSIKKMASIIKMWRHGSGEFAHFHYGGRSSVRAIEQVLKRCGVKGRIPQHAADTGYARLSAARSTLIVDTGRTETGKTGKSNQQQPRPNLLHDKNPASLFAFEFSVGQNQFIVNSGQTALEPRLNKALSQTAAHTSLTLDGYDNCSQDINIVSLDVGPANGGFLIEGTHDGYLKSYGVHHTRQLFLARGGNNLRGHDKLTYTDAPAQIPIEVIIRFHLHPLVSAAKVKNNQVLLKIHHQKAGWLFKCRGGQVFLDRSVYMAGTRRMSCQQIILRCPANQIQTIGELNLRWAFSRHSS